MLTHFIWAYLCGNFSCNDAILVCLKMLINMTDGEVEMKIALNSHLKIMVALPRFHVHFIRTANLIFFTPFSVFLELSNHAPWMARQSPDVSKSHMTAESIEMTERKKYIPNQDEVINHKNESLDDKYKNGKDFWLGTSFSRPTVQLKIFTWNIGFCVRWIY